MSDTFQVTPHERGVVRLFTVDVPPEALEDLRTPDLARALGVATLDVDQVDLFSAEDVKGLGLFGYMSQGLGISDAELTSDRARLEGLAGPFLIVRSAAFQGEAAQITVASPLRWIGTYTEENAPVQFEPLPSEAAKGTVVPDAKPAPSNAAMSGRVAMMALLVIFVLTAILVWIAA